METEEGEVDGNRRGGGGWNNKSKAEVRRKEEERRQELWEEQWKSGMWKEFFKKEWNVSLKYILFALMVFHIRCWQGHDVTPALYLNTRTASE